MPRRPRHVLADVPLHIVQRGVDRRECFLGARDFRSYLAALHETSWDYSVEIHAYALMTNHVHILATPRTDLGASKMMQQLGRKYVSYFNKSYQRTGTLWEGRFRSSMIISTRYLFACYRYIEMNPVRAGIVELPHEYRWSSYRYNAFGQPNKLLTPRPEFIELASEPHDQLIKYRRLFDIGDDKLDEEIRTACRKGVALE